MRLLKDLTPPSATKVDASPSRSLLYPGGAGWSRAMSRYSEVVKADVRRRMSPPMRQSVARISEELGIHVVTLYNWRKAWRLQGEVLLASDKDPEGWGATDKFTVVLETAGLNATELSAYCRERGLYPEQVE
jgi:transposase